MEITERKPKVSVTVVTYNHGHWLAECLESIVTQETDFLFEVIVGDDASTDGLTQKVLQDYAGRYPDLIVPVFREHNIGPTQNYFDVVRRTQGEYIAHIDGDDRMLPSKLQKQVNFLDKYPECSIVAHNVLTFDAETGKELWSFNKIDIPKISDINFLVEKGAFFCHSSKMYRRIANITWWRDKPTLDFFLHIEHASKGKIGFIHDVLGEYRQNISSVRNPNSKNYDDIVLGGFSAMQRALELGVPEEIVYKSLANLKYNYAINYLLSKRYSDCCKLIKIDSNIFKHLFPKFLLVWLFSKIPFCLLFFRFLTINYLKNKNIYAFDVSKNRNKL